MNRSRTRPNRILGAGVMLAVALALMISQSNIPTGAAQSPGGFDTAFYDVIPDAGTGISSTTPGSVFFLKGSVISHSVTTGCTPTGSPRGTWRAWGVIADDGRAVINHSITLSPMNGSIELQGTTGVTLATEPAAPSDPSNPLGTVNGPTEVLSAVGGAGTYRGANGDAQIRPYCSTGVAPFKYDRPFCLIVRENSRRRGGDNRLIQ